MARRAAVLGFTCLALALPAHAQERIGMVPQITMTGTATREVEPDSASITVGVVTEKPGAADAANENAKAAKAVIDEVKAAGIAPVDIRTSSLSLSPVYSNAKDGQVPTIRAFRASNSLSIHVRALDKVAPLLQRLLDKGVTNLSGPSFDVSNAKAIEDDLRGEAATDAKHKAEIVASGLGARPGLILDVAHGRDIAADADDARRADGDEGQRAARRGRDADAVGVGRRDVRTGAMKVLRIARATPRRSPSPRRAAPT